MLLSDNAALLAEPQLADAATTIQARPGLRLWTDDFNNLVQVLKSERSTRIATPRSR